MKHGLLARITSMTRLLGLVFLTSCVTHIPAATYPVPEPLVLALSVDSLWPAIVDLVNERQLTIKLLDRGSGLLQSERMWAGGGSQWWDCGERRVGVDPDHPTTRENVADEREIPVTITITATPQPGGRTRVRITANVGQTFTESGLRTVVAQCTSKGTFEQELLQAIAQRAAEFR
jgi:hypothetical protein